MHKRTLRFRVVIKQLWLVVSSFLFMPHFVFAANQLESLPTYSFAEFNIAFVLGLSLPLLIIMALLKPVLRVKWRFLALLTLSLLMQFFAFTSLSQWQTPTLLISGAVFVLSAFLWLQTSLSQNVITKILTWVMVGACVAFICSVFWLREVDVFQLWLVFIGSLVLLTGFTAYHSRVNKTANRRMTILIISVAFYGVALYLWLNVQASIVWVLSLSVLSYLFAIVNGCWGIVEAIQHQLTTLTIESERESNKFETSVVPLDPITNLPSYQQSLLRLKRIVSNKPDSQFVAIVFKPLNFYQVNKVLGHQNSDILLLQLAFNLQQCVCDEQLLVNFNDESTPVRISRLQGLDFLIVLDTRLSNHPVKIVVEDICQKLVAAVPQAMSFKSFSLNFELAFGAAISDDKLDFEQLIAHASDALLSGENQDERVSYFNTQAAVYTERHLAKWKN